VKLNVSVLPFLALLFFISWLGSPSSSSSSSSSPQQQSAINCAIKWNNEINNSCDRAISVHIIGNKYCTSGYVDVPAKSRAYTSCTDAAYLTIDSASFK
jgi:hypothetical protein